MNVRRNVVAVVLIGAVGVVAIAGYTAFRGAGYEHYWRDLAATTPPPDAFTLVAMGDSATVGVGALDPANGLVEREQIAADLGRHMALGRLTLNELESRLDIAYTAKTRRQLDAVIRDLPSAEPATVPARSGER